MICHDPNRIDIEHFCFYSVLIKHSTYSIHYYWSQFVVTLAFFITHGCLDVDSVCVCVCHLYLTVCSSATFLMCSGFISSNLINHTTFTYGRQGDLRAPRHGTNTSELEPVGGGWKQIYKNKMKQNMRLQ